MCPSKLLLSTQRGRCFPGWHAGRQRTFPASTAWSFSLEVPETEPGIFCMETRCSTIELQPFLDMLCMGIPLKIIWRLQMVQNSLAYLLLGICQNHSVCVCGGGTALVIDFFGVVSQPRMTCYQKDCFSSYKVMCIFRSAC